VLDGSPAWSRSLSTGSASDHARAVEFVESFSDEMGHRRAIDSVLLSHLVGIEPPDQPGPAPVSPDADPAIRLFSAIWDPGIDPGSVVQPVGPLTPEDLGVGLEIWTEQELSCLHALWWLGRRDAALADRALDAAEWHVDNIQPDNATNHPWAVHVFVHLGIARDDRTSLMHAEAMVHASRLATGRPDRFSACLLLDAARALELLDR